MLSIRSLPLRLALLALGVLLAVEALAQATLVKDINVATGQGHGYPSRVVDLGGGTLIFGARDFDAHWLYTSDGTFAGTQRVTDQVEILSGSDPVAFSGVAYFAGRTDAEGVELWRSDGSEAGTWIVADIYPGAVDSYPGSFRVVGATLYFTASGPLTGNELYETDGTGPGTILVSDIRPGSSGSHPSYLTDFGGALFFTASSSTTGNEVWKTDGTALGTEVIDLRPGSSGSSPAGLTPFGRLALLPRRRRDVGSRAVEERRDAGGDRAGRGHQPDRWHRRLLARRVERAAVLPRGRRQQRQRAVEERRHGARHGAGARHPARCGELVPLGLRARGHGDRVPRGRRSERRGAVDHRRHRAGHVRGGHPAGRGGLEPERGHRVGSARPVRGRRRQQRA